MILLLILFRNGASANEYYTNILTIIFVLYALTQVPLYYFKFFILFFIVIWMVQLSLAVYQLWVVYTQAGEVLHVVGTLMNSGVLSYYLVSPLPLIYYGLFRSNTVKTLIFQNTLRIPNIFYSSLSSKFLFLAKVTFILTCFLILFIIITARSRTAILEFSTFAAVFIILNYKNFGISILRKIHIFGKGLILVIGTVCFCLCIFWFTDMKQLSVSGRFFSWNISWSHISEHFWQGTGIGKFMWYYPQWQVEYFKDRLHVSLSNFLSASESYIILNEYLQLFLSLGVIKSFAIVGAYYIFFNLKSNQYTALLSSLKLIQIGVLICCLTSYPLHVNALLTLNALCLALAYVISNRHFIMPIIMYEGSLIIVFFNIAVFFMAIFSIVGTTTKVLAEKRWSLLCNSNISRDDKKREFHLLYKYLGDNGKFLTEYGIFLLGEREDCLQAIKILERAKLTYISSITMEATGFAYWEIKRYPEAIRHYEWLSHYIPSRFSYRYDLLILLKEAGYLTKAKCVAKEILLMPVKIPSTKVKMIRQQTLKIMATL